MKIKKVKESHGHVEFRSNAQMVLWNASDYETVKNHYEKCQDYTIEIDTYTTLANGYRRNYEKYRNNNDLITSQKAEAIANEGISRLNKLIDELEQGTKKYKYADKKNGFELNKGMVEPQTIAISDNTLVNPALKIYAKQIANAGTEDFRYIASGTSSLATTPDMNDLRAENSRLDIFVNGGFRNPNGDVVREGVVFPPALDDALVKEFGSFTQPAMNAGTMQWRNVIDVASEQIEHDQGDTFYSIAHNTILEIGFIECG
jgi:hypothetical protein